MTGRAWPRWTPIEPDRRFNDGKCDPRAAFLAGTMGYAKRTGMGALYRLDPDGNVERLLGDVTISNGLAWSEDGRTFYYIDTPTRRVDAFDYDPPPAGSPVGVRGSCCPTTSRAPRTA